MKYIDSHAHINTKYFKENVEIAIKQAIDNNVVKLVMPSTNVQDSLNSIKLSKTKDFLFATVGLHPADHFDVNECDYLKSINPEDIVAVGEVGIDLYRKENPPLSTQKQIFEQHIKFAIKHDKVLIIHMRDAEEEVYEMLLKHKPKRFVMHSYTASYAWALKFLELGGYISFSGIVTFKNAHKLKETAKRLPINRIIGETDAPFLTPVPHRGKPNTPAYVKHTVDYIASIRAEEDYIVVNNIFQNTMDLFKL